MKLRLKHFLKFTSLLLYLFVLSCEDVELAYPGNTQDLKASPPKGSFAWDINIEVLDNVGQLPENLGGTHTTLGIIKVDDNNPDDEIKSVTIQSLRIAYASSPEDIEAIERINKKSNQMGHNLQTHTGVYMKTNMNK